MIPFEHFLRPERAFSIAEHVAKACSSDNQLSFQIFFQTTTKLNRMDFYGRRKLFVDQFVTSIFLRFAGLI